MRTFGISDFLFILEAAKWTIGLSLIACAPLAGCSGGDFFRTRADMRSDDMHKWMGPEATGSIGMKASQFQLTDNERLLRDLAYPLIEPPHSRPLWKSVFGDYKPIEAPWRQTVVFDRTAYGKLLIDEPHRSDSSRYSQLIDDVRDDITRRGNKAPCKFLATLRGICRSQFPVPSRPARPIPTTRDSRWGSQCARWDSLAARRAPGRECAAPSRVAS